MEDTSLELTKSLIVQDFEIEVNEDPLNEEELFALLSNQIAYMIEYRLEFLLSLMYRLDIDEAKVRHVLSPHFEEPANIGLARIVLDRQKKRVFTKLHYKQDKDIEDVDAW